MLALEPQTLGRVDKVVKNESWEGDQCSSHRHTLRAPHQIPWCLDGMHPCSVPFEYMRLHVKEDPANRPQHTSKVLPTKITTSRHGRLWAKFIFCTSLWELSFCCSDCYIFGHIEQWTWITTGSEPRGHSWWTTKNLWGDQSRITSCKTSAYLSHHQ